MTQVIFDDLLARPVAGAYAPGTAFAYSNLGYAVLGRVVEAVTGRRFVDHVMSELLNPLGLADTTYDYRTVSPERLALGYRLTRGCEWELQHFTAPGSFSAIGGLLSTVGDIGRWVAWLSDAFPPRDGSDGAVLARASRREMQQPHRLVPFDLDDGSTGQTRVTSRGFPWGLSGYGYGLFVESAPQWGPICQHLGGYPGFGSYIGLAPGQRSGCGGVRERDVRTCGLVCSRSVGGLTATGSIQFNRGETVGTVEVRRARGRTGYRGPLGPARACLRAQCATRYSARRTYRSPSPMPNN